MAATLQAAAAAVGQTGTAVGATPAPLPEEHSAKKLERQKGDTSQLAKLCKFSREDLLKLKNVLGATIDMQAIMTAHQSTLATKVSTAELVRIYEADLAAIATVLITKKAEPSVLVDLRATLNPATLADLLFIPAYKAAFPPPAAPELAAPAVAAAGVDSAPSAVSAGAAGPLSTTADSPGATVGAASGTADGPGATVDAVSDSAQLPPAVAAAGVDSAPSAVSAGAAGPLSTTADDGPGATVGAVSDSAQLSPAVAASAASAASAADGGLRVSVEPPHDGDAALPHFLPATGLGSPSAFPAQEEYDLEDEGHSASMMAQQLADGGTEEENELLAALQQQVAEQEAELERIAEEQQTLQAVLERTIEEEARLRLAISASGPRLDEEISVLELRIEQVRQEKDAEISRLHESIARKRREGNRAAEDARSEAWRTSNQITRFETQKNTLAQRYHQQQRAIASTQFQQMRIAMARMSAQAAAGGINMDRLWDAARRGSAASVSFGSSVLQSMASRSGLSAGIRGSRGGASAAGRAAAAPAAVRGRRAPQ